MTMISMVVFAGALSASFAVFGYTLVPAVPRIAALLSGRDESVVLPHLVLRDRRPQPLVRLAPTSNQARLLRAAA